MTQQEAADALAEILSDESTHYFSGIENLRDWKWFIRLKFRELGIHPNDGDAE